MKKFVKNILLFLLPVLLIISAVGAFYFIAKRIGELNSIEMNVELQRNNPECLIGLGYNEQNQYYKLLNANFYESPIISLGTSRVMQFKQECFAVSFYNCGGAVSGNYNEYRNYLQNLDYTPETVIVGLDAWVFNDAWNRERADYNDFEKIEETDRSKTTLIKSIMADWFSKKWTMADLELYPNNIGFNGRAKDCGFMSDGSYYNGDIYRDPTLSTDYKFSDTLYRINNGVQRFQWGENIDPDTLKQLNNLLFYCKTNNINVIGFLAPFAPSIYEEMSESGNYHYLDEIAPACQDLFNQYEYEFYNYMDGTSLNMTDNNFLDGFHGSEIVYGHILEDMIENGSSVGRYVDLNRTKRLLENAYDDFVFEKPDK